MLCRNYDPNITKEPSIVKFSLNTNNGSVVNNPELAKDLTINPIIKNGLATGLNIHAVNLGTNSVPAYKASRHIFGDIDENGNHNRITAKDVPPLVIAKEDIQAEDEVMTAIGETLDEWHVTINSINKYVHEHLFYFVDNAENIVDLYENIRLYTQVSCELMFEEFLGNLAMASGPIAPINADNDAPILNSASTNNPIIRNTKLPISYGRFKELTLQR